MAYGTLITSIAADLSQLDKDLEEAKRRLNKFYDDVSKRTIPVSLDGVEAGGRGGGGVGGGGGAGRRRRFDVAGFENDVVQRIPARLEENEGRRFLAIKQKAVNDNAKIDAAARKKEDAENLRSYKAQLADEKTLELARIDEEKRVREERKKTDAENLRSYKAQLADEQTLANFRKEMLEKGTAEAKLDAKARSDAEKELQGMLGQQNTEYVRKGMAADKARTAELEKSAQAAARLNQHFESMKSALGNITRRLKNIAGFLGIGAFAGIGAAVTEAFNYNRELQLTKLSLASDLELTTKIVDAHGKQVDRQKELNINLAYTQQVLAQIRKEAESSTLTEKELQAVSRIGLAAALRGGAAAHPEQAIHLTAQLANLSKILQPNLGPEQLVANVRSVIGASPAVRRTALGQVLDLDPKQLRMWKDQGTLVQHLLNILKRAQPIIDQASASFDHLFSTLVSKGQRFLQLSFEKVFEKITGRILDLNTAFSDEKIEKWAAQFSDDLMKVYDAIENFAKSDGLKRFEDLFKYIVAHAGEILKVLIALKVLQGVNTAVKIGQDVGTVLSAGRGAGNGGAPSGLLGLLGGAIKFIGRRGGAAAAGGEAGEVGSTLTSTTEATGAGTFLAGAESAVGGGGASGLTMAMAGKTNIALGILYDLFTASYLVKIWMDTHRNLINASQLNENLLQIKARGVVNFSQRLAAQDIETSRHQRTVAVQATATARARNMGMGITPQMSPEEIRQRLPGILLRGSEAGLHRVALEEDQTAKKKKKARDLQEWLHRLLAKGTEDQEEQYKLQYKADAESVYDKLGLTKKANEVVRSLHKELVDKINDYEETQANADRKRLADLRDDKLAQLKAEYIDNLKTIKDETASDEEEARERLAAYQKFQRDKAEILRNWNNQAHNLAREAISNESNLQRERRSLLKETADLQKRLSKQTKDLTREEADAQRDLSRAEVDRKMAQQRLFGTPSRRIPGQFLAPGYGSLGRIAAAKAGIAPGPGELIIPGRTIPGIPSFTAEQESIRTAAQQLFNRSNIGQFLNQQFLNQGQTPEFAQANTSQQLRDLINQVQEPGNAGEVLRRLQELGIPATPEFAGRVEQLGARSLNLQGRQEEAQHATEQEQIRREQEDVNRPVQDARRRIADLADQEAQARKEYQEGIKRIQDEYKQQIVDITNSFVQLGDETRKLTREMAASNQRIPMDLRGILAPFLRETRGQAQAHVAHALAPVYHITFGPGSLQVKDLSLPEIKSALHALLQKEGRAAPPPRR